MSGFIPKVGGPKPPPFIGPGPAAPQPSGSPSVPPMPEPAGLQIHGPRALCLGEATAAAMGDALPSQFPLHDLSQLETTGRAAAGFRLDGGALRLMWLSARRIREPTHGDGYEVSFFAHGGTINKLEARMKAQSAKSGSFVYSTRELDEAAPAGRARLVSGAQTWGPSATALRLEQPGKFDLELVPTTPEALKGAVRIRVYGDDAAATKNLQQVVSQLGLQKLFAPPKPADLERFKLFRFLWHFAPEKLEGLKFRSPALIDEKVMEETFAELAIPEKDPALVAADAAPLDEPALAAYLSHLHVFATQKPQAFFGWATKTTSQARGLLPAPSAHDPSAGLRSAMKTAGIDLESPALKAKLAEPISPATARRYLDFGVIVARNNERARQLCAAEIDQIGLEPLRTLIQEAGFDPADPRLQGLRFEAVYPGYFTVVDPSLPDRLAELGARYLYSTADTAERAIDMLTEGQKSSATRFAEGRLVQGKSSSSDFGTGGAFSVFTRLVTESAIQKKSSFMNWGGSRPFKIILSRDVLSRLDWYGYNSDNYGRTTNLTAAHHGEALVKTIQSSYGSTNELMFPVGNAPAFFDFVVCETEAQRKKLLELLTARGVESFNGKPIEQFVRVEKTFFEHPRDQTLENAVRAALAKLALTGERKALEDELRTRAVSKLDGWAETAAAQALQKEAPSVAATTAEKAAQGSAKIAAAKAALQLEAEIAADQLGPIVSAASQAAAQKVLSELLPSLKNDIPRGPVATIIRSAGKDQADLAAQAAAEALFAAELPGLLGKLPKDLSQDAQRAWLKTEISKLSKAELLESVKSAAAKAAEPAARETASTSIRHHLAKVATKAVRTAAEEQAMESARTAAVEQGSYEAVRQGIISASRPQVLASAEKALQSSLTSRLSTKLAAEVQQQLKLLVSAEAETLRPTVESAVQKALTSVALEAAESFAQSIGAPLTEAMKAEAMALGQAKVSDRAKVVAEEQAQRVAETLPKVPINAAVTKVLQAALSPLIGSTAQDAAESALASAAEEATLRILRKKFGPLAQEAVSAAMEPARAAAAESWAPVLAAEVLEKTTPAMAEYYVDKAFAARLKSALLAL